MASLFINSKWSILHAMYVLFLILQNLINWSDNHQLAGQLPLKSLIHTRVRYLENVYVVAASFVRIMKFKWLL